MASKVLVSAVRNLASLSALEEAWHGVHGVDPLTNVFTSWAWMWGRLSALPHPWWVLVARFEPGGPIVGLLPLRTATEHGLTMAGSPLADYTGFLCRPDEEDAVLPAFARFLQDQMSWQQLAINDSLDPRIDTFLASFPESQFQITQQEPTPCPRLDLEDSWELYLQRRVRPRRRQTIRRKLRTIENLPGLRKTTISEGGETQIAALLGLWQMRWGKLSEAELAPYRSVILSCLRSDCLWLDMLWDERVPVAGLLAFLDRAQSRFCFYISGYDAEYADWSPGTVIVAHSIREAIRGGYRVYDFLRGDEPYKYSFGACPNESRNIVVQRKDFADIKVVGQSKVFIQQGDSPCSSG